MEPALVVLLILAAGSALAWGASRWSPRIVVGGVAAFLAFGGVVLPSGVLAEVAPPIVRLTEQRAGVVAAEVTYRVVPGDSLWRIAERFLAERTGAAPTKGEIARFWPRIYAANRTVIGDHPCLIHPGQMLRIPSD